MSTELVQRDGYNPVPKVRPITPKEVIDKKQETIPYEVIEAFNELIAEEWNGNRSVIKQDEIVEKITSKLHKYETWKFNYKWLDVEDIYTKAGWKVEYDKPAYNEDYDASFTFTKKKG